MSAITNYNSLNPLDCGDVIFEILSHCDLNTLERLACVNKLFNECIRAYTSQMDLTQLCPKLIILDAKTQGIPVDDEPYVNKLQILRYYNKLVSHVESEEGLTLMTIPKGLTLQQLVAIADTNALIVDTKLETVPIEQTYIILITNNVFKESRQKTYDQQKTCVASHGCTLPTVLEYVALCVFTRNVFQKYLYGRNPWTFGRSSTYHDYYYNNPLIIGGTGGAEPHDPVDLLDVFSNDKDFICEEYGAGGQRRF